MRKHLSLLWIAAAIAALWFAGTQHRQLVERRAGYRLDALEPLENAPPLMVFNTVVLGGFRGVIADILWLRVSYLQDQGRYLEIVQLADWITKLEPRHTEIWAFHAWNMAYNVSISMTQPEDRWRWVNNGIHLLRDEGLRYNAADPQIYFELGWIFQHKLGGYSDRDHAFYKRRWAQEMAALFSGPRPDYERLASEPAKAHLLRSDYKLEPEIMREIEQTYGPLDWRLPHSHAVYWGTLARKRTHSDFLPADRMVVHSLIALFMRVPEQPDILLLPGILKTYEDLLVRYPGYGINDAYRDFLAVAVVVLEQAGQRGDAQSLFNRLKDRFDPPEARNGMADFVRAFERTAYAPRGTESPAP